MSNQIKVSVSCAGVKFELSAPLALLFKPKAPSVSMQIAQRFLTVFAAHGIHEGLIPRVIPQITIQDLQSSEHLMKALTTDIIEIAEKTFGLQPGWIEGATEEIYPPWFCYKDPKELLTFLEDRKPSLSDFPVFILCDKSAFSRHKKHNSMAVALVVQEEVKELPDGTNVYRYTPYLDGWDWGEPPCRLQLKAMARIVYLKYGKPVPIYQATEKEIEAVRNRKKFPHEFIKGSPLTEPSLEDFALSPQESAIAQQTEELPFIFEYMDAKDLDPDGIYRLSRRDPIPGKPV